jgi:hypothetical protein
MTRRTRREADMKQWAAGLVILTLAACAAPVQQQAPPAFDPVGTYDFATDVQGTTIQGVLTIRRTEQGLVGAIGTELTGELPFNRITLEGRRADMRAATPDGDLLMRVDFLEDGRITGGWELAGGVSGTVSGQRRQS